MIQLATLICLHSAPLPRLQSYAVGETTRGRYKGNVARACGRNSYVFSSEALSIVAGLGFVFLGFFIHLAMPVIFRRYSYLQTLASNANNYSFESFGFFWGISTTLFVCVITVIGSDLWFLIALFHNLGSSMQVVWVIYIIIIFLLPFASALIIALNSTFTVPHLYLLIFECCCKRNPLVLASCWCCQCSARTWATLLVLWFDMLALQLLCHHGVVAVLAIPAAPVTIVTNILFVLLIATCTIHIIAFLFTFCAKLMNRLLRHVEKWVFLTYWVAMRSNSCPAASDKIKDDSWAYLVRVIVLIPFLLAISFFSTMLAFSGKYVNTATNQDNFLSFLLSIFIPLLLSGIGIGSRLFISKWLRNDVSQQKPRSRITTAAGVNTEGSGCMNWKSHK